MTINLLDILQDEIEVKSHSEVVSHPKHYYERGYKLKYDLWSIVSGQVQFTYKNECYTLSSGDSFLMYPNVIYEASFMEDATFVYTKFDFSLNGSANILDHLPLDGYLAQADMTKQEFKSVDQLFKSCFIRESSLKQFRINHYFKIIILLFLDYKMTTIRSLDIKSYKKLNKFLPALDRMHISSFNQMTIGDYAKMCHMSEKYFITSFKEVFGVTPYQYINHIRMKKAVAYIRERQYTIKEIAYKLNYSDPYNFSVAFKKYHGLPPSLFLTEGTHVIEQTHTMEGI